jgi:hypothetical protein
LAVLVLHSGAGKVGSSGDRDMSGVALHHRTAFADAHHWRPEPAPEAADEAVPTAVELALHLLREIAEDPVLRGRQRVAARRYLRRLEAQTAGAPAAP